MKKHIALLLFLSIAIIGCKRTTINGLNTPNYELNLNEKFSIQFPEDHRKGETWQPTELTQQSIVEYNQSVWEGNEKGVNFLYKATETGSIQLQFKKLSYNQITDTATILIVVK
jgi:hypothetical protein